MSKVEIYTTRTCPYCHRAKALLNAKSVSFLELDVTQDPELRGKMTTRANGRYTVPQIFIDNKHIGGCDDLYALEEDGELDSLLQK